MIFDDDPTNCVRAVLLTGNWWEEGGIHWWLEKWWQLFDLMIIPFILMKLIIRWKFRYLQWMMRKWYWYIHWLLIVDQWWYIIVVDLVVCLFVSILLEDWFIFWRLMIQITWLMPVIVDDDIDSIVIEAYWYSIWVIPILILIVIMVLQWWYIIDEGISIWRLLSMWLCWIVIIVEGQWLILLLLLLLNVDYCCYCYSVDVLLLLILLFYDTVGI